jgi:cytochrome c553
MKHLALSVLLSLVLVGCAEEEEAAVAPPADIGAGKAIAETQCAGCHGLDGRGTAPGIPNMAAQADGYLIESLQAYKEGKRMHAALRDMTTQLSDADIRNVVGYYASLPPLEAAAAPKPEDVLSPYEKGKAAAGACAQCHGEDGNSRTAGTPTVAGQQPVYFVSAVRAYLDGRRRLIGKEMMRELGKADLESLALYYASQTPAKREAPAVGDPAAGEPLSARCGGCHGAHGVSNDSAAFYAVQESQAVESTRVTVQDLAAKCDRCHGPDVENPTMAIPKISGQDRDYLIKALRAYHDGKRGSSMMHRMSLPYSEAIMESVASHYASQPAK